MTTKPTSLAVRPENVPAELRDRPQWVCWDHRLKDGKWAKTPINARTGQLAESDNPLTWSTFDEAVAAMHRYAGIGYVFTDDDPFCGVDLDGCRDPQTGELELWAQEALVDVPSYSEVSPSGTGLKVFVRGKHPGGRKQWEWKLDSGERQAIEIYDRGRYFAVTGHVLSHPGTIVDCQPGLNELHRIAFPDGHAQKNGHAGNDRDKALDALAALSPTRAVAHQDWIEVGMALNSVDSSPAMLAEWDRWSRNCPDKYREGECAKRWGSFCGTGGLGIGSLVHWAKQDGWQPPRAANNGQYVSAANRSDEHLKPRIRTVEQLTAEFPELREPVIEGICRRGEIVNVIAPPKARKSWLAIDLALSVATGREWLGMQTRRGDVLILDNELHANVSAKRIPDVADARGIPLKDYGAHVGVDNLRGRGRLPSIEGLACYFNALERGQFSVIILDAFYRFMPDGISENDNAAIAQVYNLLDTYAQRLDCVFILIHHTSKGSQAGKSVTDVGSGAGSQSRAADAHLVLREHDSEDCAVLEGAVRSFAPLAPRGLRWTYPVWNLDQKLNPRDLKQPESPRKRTQDRDDREGVRKILDALRKAPATMSRIRELTGLSHGRANRLLPTLTASGVVGVSVTKVRGNETREYAISKVEE